MVILKGSLGLTEYCLKQPIGKPVSAFLLAIYQSEALQKAGLAARNRVSCLLSVLPIDP